MFNPLTATGIYIVILSVLKKTNGPTGKRVILSDGKLHDWEKGLKFCEGEKWLKNGKNGQ